MFGHLVIKLCKKSLNLRNVSRVPFAQPADNTENLYIQIAGATKCLKSSRQLASYSTIRRSLSQYLTLEAGLAGKMRDAKRKGLAMALTILEIATKDAKFGSMQIFSSFPAISWMRFTHSLKPIQRT